MVFVIRTIRAELKALIEKCLTLGVRVTGALGKNIQGDLLNI